MGHKHLAAIFGICALAGAAQAAVTVDPIILSPPTVQSTTGIDQFHVNGAQMVGMKVTSSFSDGSSSFGIWSATGGDNGGAGVTVVGAAGYWALDESADTFINAN